MCSIGKQDADRLEAQLGTKRCYIRAKVTKKYLESFKYRRGGNDRRHIANMDGISHRKCNGR